MSADNYIAIKCEDGKYVGYMQSASAVETYGHEPVFSCETIREAVLAAQEQVAEYGYIFKDL
jgi:hypothetical protein